MKKIMFKDKYGLTDAVLQGRKTMTRRICKEKATGEIIYTQDVDSVRLYVQDGITEFVMKNGEIKVSVLPYKVGEVVAVAQSYRSFYEEYLDYTIPSNYWNVEYFNEKGYKNKMFVKASEMPHQIRITDIKVEKLQGIRDEDCLKEGVKYQSIPTPTNDGTIIMNSKPCVYDRQRGVLIAYECPYKAFADLIDKVSGKGTWEKNPFVFAYSFELVK